MRINLISTWVVLFFSWIGTVNSQEIQLTASAKPIVVVGENFTLMYSVNGQAMNFRGPNLSNFTLLSGPLTSQSSSIRSINGRTSVSVSYTFSYILQAYKEGTFDIPQASVLVDNKTYQSNGLTIKVVKNSGGNQPQGQVQGTNPQGTGNQQRPGAAESGSNDVMTKASVTNASPYQGEGIIVTYKLYFKVNIGNVNITKFSSFPGFWSQNLISENDKQQPYKQMIDGEQYVVVDIRKVALFPLKGGKLVIDPLELNCVAEIKKQTKTRTGDPFFDNFFNDSFFNNSVTVEKSLKSNPLVINVKSLPSEDKPSDFNGAVGNFTFRPEIDKTKLKTNEPINLKFVIAGQGNIQLIDKMNVNFPPDFETYDPKITSDIKTGQGGISGSQTFEYLMIPRKPGRFIIKPITFSFFDPGKHRYISFTSPQYTIDVEKGTGDATNITYSGASKEEIKYIGSDIRHIKNQPLQLCLIGSVFFLSTTFFLLLIIPLVVFILLVILWKKQHKQRSDIRLMRNRKATKIASKRLKKAHDNLKAGKQEEFYIEISQALWGYLSDKFGIPLAELSMDSIHEALVKKNVQEEIISQFAEALTDTEFARFAPGDKSLAMGKTYEKALELISKIERELR